MGMHCIALCSAVYSESAVYPSLRGYLAPEEEPGEATVSYLDCPLELPVHCNQ